MSVTADFYLSRAAECAQAARDTSLENVRERSLRAEAAWLAMANKIIHVEERRKREAQDKTARAIAEGEVPWPIMPTRPRTQED